MRELKAVVGAILLEGGRVLLGHRSPDRAKYPDCWDVPGGHVEPGETPQAALQRELREELGIQIDVGDRDPDLQLLGDGYLLRLWLVRAWRGEVRNAEPLEHDQMGWFAQSEVESLTLADPRYRGVIASYLSEAMPD